MQMQPGNVRQSETTAQQQHEDDVLQGQVFSSDQDGVAQDDQDAIEEKPVSFTGKVKGVLRKLNPVSPTAMADIRIMKNSTNIEGLVTKDLRDVERFPEVAKVAEVRRGLGLAPGEQSFLASRKAFVRDHFASYIGVDPSEVHLDDVPVVAFGGSGGGFRAMIGVLGYCDEMKRSGLWDILTYVSGVSGSCWSLASYFTFGSTSFEKLIQHCKKRLSPHHPLSSDAIRAVLSAPGGAHAALGPIIQKHYSGLETVAMDLYAVFTTGHVFLHDPSETPGGSTKKEVAGYHRDWFKWSNALRYLQAGAEPMPILTAIRHERPWKDWADEEHPFHETQQAEKHEEARDAWFQWFEMTPYEVGCDELEAWVPIWGFGRPFEEGKSTMQLPEQSLALLLGLCTSAPAGPLTSYLSTIERNLPKNFIGNQINNLASGISKMWGKQGTEIFQQHHPLHACNEHNFLFHLTPANAEKPRPPGIENSPRIHLLDSGMDNNCPTYVLLHPNREVDVIINMDASSDVQKDTFQQRVDQIGSRKGLKFTKRHDIKPGEDTKDPDRFRGMYAQIYDGVLTDRPLTVIDSYGNTVTTPPAPVVRKDCTMVYMPMLPNEKAVASFDPSTAKFSGSYNLVWTPEQVEMLVKVCVQNFRDGEETVKQALREAWQRKKALREGQANLAGQRQEEEAVQLQEKVR